MGFTLNKKEMWVKGGCKLKSEINKQKLASPCQDSFYILQDIKNKFLCVAVADGAGSAILSDIGASLVTKNICKFLLRKFDVFFNSDPSIVKKSIIHSLRTALGKTAKKQNALISDFASTMLFVCIKHDKIIVAHLGDGIILYNKLNKITILSQPENGEFINQTYFVTSKYYMHHLRLYKGSTEDISGFYLMTDGISNLFCKRNKPISDEFILTLNSLDNSSDQALTNAIENFMKLRVVKRTRDDSTLVIIQT